MALRKPIQILIEAKDKTAAAFRSVNRQLDTAATRVRDIGSRLGLAFGVFAGGGLAASIKRSVDSLDRLGKVAETIGATTEGLSKLRFAADQAGISSQTLDDSLIRFNRRLGDAAAGTGEAAGALERLGINAEKLASLSFEDRIYQIADALQEVKNETDKGAIAVDLFGRAGGELVRLFAGGSISLEEFAERLKELNGVIGKESTDNAADFNDTMGEFQVQLDAISNTIAENLVPNWTNWLRLVNEGANSRFGSGGLVSQEIEAVGEKIVELQEKIAEARSGPSFWESFFAPAESGAYSEQTEQIIEELTAQLEDFQKKKEELILGEGEKRALKRRESEERRHNREMAAARDEQTKAMAAEAKRRAAIQAEEVAAAKRYAAEQAALTAEINSLLSGIGTGNESVERIDVLRKSVEAWDELAEGNFAEVLALVKDGLGLLSEYEGEGGKSAAEIITLKDAFAELAEAAGTAQKQDLAKGVQAGKQQFEELKKEIESKPATVIVRPDSSSGKNVHVGTQALLNQEGPVVVDVALNITGVASGESPAANGDQSLVSEVENQSDKRGHRL